ncbi:MAG: MBL fold metallo-hydrolase [Nocardioidaceae bacterium]
MRLTIVGCAGSYAGPDSAASCYLLEADDRDGRTWRVLLDLGSGSLGPLHHFVDPLAIDAVFLTHLHPDHYFDISGHYVVRKYHPDGPQPRIPLWGPAGTQRQVAVAYGLPQDPGMTEEFEFHEYDGRPVRLGPFTVHAHALRHPVRAFGVRVECAGRVLAYSGDTGPCRELEELAQGADLLLCEAAFVEGRDNPEDLHLTGREAGEAAAAAGVGRLVLTHIPAWHDKQIALGEAKTTYDWPVDLAATGATYDV